MPPMEVPRTTNGRPAVPHGRAEHAHPARAAQGRRMRSGRGVRCGRPPTITYPHPSGVSGVGPVRGWALARRVGPWFRARTARWWRLPRNRLRSGQTFHLCAGEPGAVGPAVRGRQTSTGPTTFMLGPAIGSFVAQRGYGVLPGCSQCRQRSGEEGDGHDAEDDGGDGDWFELDEGQPGEVCEDAAGQRG